MELVTQLEHLANRPDNAEAGVVDLQNQIVRMHSDRKPLAMSALFNKQGGILAVLKTNRESFTPKAKYLMLDFIAELVKKQYATSENVPADIHATCWLLFSHSKELSAVKKSAVHVLVALVEEKLLDSSALEAMIKRFMTSFIQNQSKLVSSVKCAILELFGASVRYYPNSFTIDKQDPEHIKRRLLTTMSTCINSSNPDMELLAGAVLGLGNYLYSFDITEAESKDAFATIRKMIIPLENQTRYAVPKAGLIFIKEHAEKFGLQICADRDTVLFIHGCLKNMSSHPNRDLHKLGYGAMTAFLKQVTRSLVEKELGSTEIEIFWYFVKDFINTLNKATSDQYMELSLAVRGLGLFAGPCRVLLAEKELMELQSILVRKLSSLTSSSNDAKYAHISAFMDAFQMLAYECKTINTEFVTAIEEISVSMTLNFSKVRVYYRPPLVNSFVELLWELNQHGLLRSFWGRMAKQLLVISCVEKEHDANTSDELAAESRDPSWKEYTTFWESLFSSSKQDWAKEDLEKFRHILYDGMITAILELPGNLNLNMREREVEGVDNTSGGGGDSKKQAVSISADASKLVADNPADFVVFVAFVSLCDALLPKIQVVLFEKWIFVAGQKLISYSSHHPLVSGFYKLFGVVLTISESLKYFAVKGAGPDDMDHDGIPEVSDSQKSAHSLFSNYIAEVLLKMRQFKDDLLVSCLKMVLASPIELTRIESLCLPIIESLKMGLSYTPLAIVALDAIESWAKKLDRKVLKPSYGRVLPSLNDYLMLDLDTGDSVAASTSTGKFAKKSRSKHLKTHGVSEQEMDEQAIQTLKTIQIRILKLLGSLGQDSRLMLSDSVANANLIAWDTTKNLKVQIPFKEAIFDVYFDDMLPRIIELAESSPDRKTKVAANELLHALVIIMIGGSQNRSETDARTPYHMIYVKIFPVLLRLAVDLDKVTRELFRPLVIQLVHWLTKNSKYENPETMALLKASFDAVASSNGPLREFGAECIAEYLKWSIKHASEKELENNPINAKSLFKRMYGLCQHSSPTKRLSAAIIVNRIYTIFRESNALVDVFTVEILYYLMFSLKLADGDNPALGTLSLAKIAIDNMAKIIVVKYDIFIRRGNNRRTFPGVDQCDLANVVRWIFEESRSKELEYSYKCIELFDKFAQKLGGVSSWIKNALAKTDRYIYNLFDVPEAAIIDEPIRSAKQQSWLLSLRSCLILYRYLIDRNALAPSAIFQLSGVVASITTFLKVCDDKEVSTLTVAVKKWKSDRAFVFLKVLELIHSAHSRLSASEKTVLDPIFSCQSFYNLLGLTVFEPQAVGFDVALQETKSELFNRTVEVIGGLNRNFSSAFKSKLIAAFAALLSSSEIDLRNTDISSRSQTTKYLQATSGLKIVRCCSMLQPVLQKIGTSQSQYMTQILNNISNLLKSNDLVQIELGGSILSECLECEDSRMAAFKTVLCPPTQDQGSIALAKEKYEKLAAFINCGICRYPNSFVEVLQGGVETSLVLLVLDNFLNWLGSPGESFEKDVESFIQQITETDGFVKTAVLLYDRAGEDVLTRFWRKILQVKPDRLNIAADNAFSETFWNEFFIGFNFKSSLKRLNVLFELLPLVILTPKSQRIEDSLSSIVTEKFPLVSQTVDGSDELLDDYRVSMSKLLNIMQQAVGSTVLERVLILHLCRDANHAFNEAFVDALSIKVPKMISTVLLELWKFAFEFAVQGKNMPDLRLNVAKTLLLPILQSMQQDDLIGFYVANVKEIMTILGAITLNEDEAATKHILVTKTICFFLMETAYKRVPSSELHSATGRVLKSFVGPAKTGEKEITIALIKAGGDFKKKQPLDSAAIAPYRLSLNQSSFNAISACLLATQSLAKVEIFNAYLFVEKPLLWDNIVDTSKSIFISTDLDSPLIRVGIREFSEKSSSLAAKKKYISTQFLADSSLSQMSSLFGKGDPRRQSLTQSSLPSITQSISSMGSQTDFSTQFLATDLTLNDVVGELELDIVNGNICMKGILSVINRLPFSDKDIDMPVWMKSLLGKIEKPDTHINIRLFIAKIVINITSVFTPFAKFWWKPIAQLIQDADLFGSGINYFVQDLCLILMEWTKNANSFTKTTDKEVILKTIRWLIRHCNHESKSTIRNHLRIVRALIENWKPYVIAPSDVIFDLLHAKVDVNSKSEKYLNLTGIYVLQSFVANDIAFYDPNGLTDRIFSETEMLDLLNGLLISSKYKELFSPLAECVGDVLAYLDKIGSASRFPFLSKVDEACKRRSALETKSYIQIVNRISVNYPRILESQYKNLLNLFSKLDLDLKGKTLEALLSFADEIPDLFTEIIGLDLEDILRSQDEECQTFTLGILGILAPSLTRQQISKFLPMSVEIFLLHQSDRCRAAFFSLVHKLNECVSVKTDEDLKRLVKFSLLRGLSDSDDGIRNSLLEFFNNKVFGEKTVFERALDLISEWYIPEVEDVFLKYSVHFLLEASKLTPVFEQKVYDRGLPDARFNDRDIVVDLVWEKSSSMLPLFAATQDGPSFSMDDNGGAVRTTQDLVWTPTQEVNAKSARNMFSRAPSEFDARSQSQSLSTQPGVNRNTIRRSYATKKESTFFAYDAERKKKESRNIDRFKKSASQRSVTLFRKYREGELPDIEIKHREVIAPLQSLAARDNDISRQLFSILATRISTDQSVNGEEIGLAFNTVFRTSSALSAPFIGSVLQVMFNNSELIQRANPALIAHVASGSSNFELGALVIEKGIQDGLFSSSDAKRSKTGARTLKKSPEGWVPLASLFKDIKQVEVYQSIYESHIASSVITKEAIAAELLGDFETAKNKYLEGLESENLEANEAEPKLWSTERLECMNKLGEWNDLATSVLHDVDNNIERVWEEDKVDPYLKLFLRSHLKLRNTSAALEDSDIDVGAVKTLIEDAKKDVTKRQILEQYFATDLLTNAFASNDLNLTRHYVHLSWKRFISSFAGLNPSATTSKMDMLSSLQPICEYDEFLTFAKLARTGTVSKEDIDSVFSTWRVRFPASTDSISIWDDVIGSRKLMISKTSAMFDGLVISNTEDLVAEFHATVVSDDLLYSRQMAKAASKQNLFTVASRWLETANANTGEFVPEFMQLYYKFLLRQSDHENGSMNKFKLLENIIKHVDYYKKSIRNTGPAFQLKFLTLEVRALSRLLNLARDLPSSDSFFIGLASSKSLTKFTGGQKVETKKDLLDFFLSRSKLNIRLLHGLSVPAHNFQKGLIEIGMFVDKALRSIETDPALGSGNGNAVGLVPESAKLIVNSIFRAMAIGSPKAAEFFPRLLQLLDQYPGLRDEFETQSKECPTWMFLRWLPQLTSLLDKPSGLSVLPLVFRIAKLYPNALRFPFTISCEQYRFSPETAQNAKLVDNLKQLLHSEVYNKFTLELRRLEDPAHILKDFCERFESLVASSSLPSKQAAIKRAFDELKELCLETRKTGDLVKKFAEKHNAKISSICANGERFDEKRVKELESYRQKLGNVDGISVAGKNLLKNYSIWLDEYQSGNLDPSEYLEIPGQYTGEKEPDLAEHVYISSFDHSVLVMGSIRKPKRLIMIGSDGKEYPWLAKGGEDLRLDQRIEQMFTIMNTMIEKNQYCIRNRVSLATYQVVPMSTSLGLIEWVDNTKPLKSCMESSPSFKKNFPDSQAVFMEFVNKHGKNGYETFLQTASSKHVTENIQSLWIRNRESYLRHFFIRLTVSPEAFFQVRTEFANSLAALNICQYLLGIGDRHLDNFLVDLKTGRIIGIDFGHAFGSATELLPVPELVPFRLTNQIEKFLLPLGVQSLIVHPMTNVLSAVQDDKERLLNALNIFVNEPLIEWRKFAEKQIKRNQAKSGGSSMGGSSSGESTGVVPPWYPQQKLEVAKRKLEGENPAFITGDELAIGHEKKKWFKNMKGALMGDAAVNVRAKTGRVCLNPREQVDCLVDLAMDPNVLGRAWVGWAPFM